MAIYRVQGPDGSIYRFEGPDDATQDQVLAAAAQQFQPTPEPEPDTGFFDMARRAVIRGGKQTGSLLADVLPAMAAKAVGADEYAAKQMAEAKATQEEIAQKYAARYGELKDVKGFGDILPFISETVLEQVPNIATALVPGVGGAGLGARVAAGQAAKTLAGREATEAAAAKYGAQAMAKGATRGSIAGTYLGSYALNAPEVFQNIYDETGGQMEVGASLLAGSVAAALDSVLPAYLINKFTPGMKAGVVEKILEKSGMPPGIARGAVAGVIEGAAAEAPTEAAQEAISIAAEKFVQENAPAWGSKEFNRIIEAGVRGGVGGGGISGAAGAIKGMGAQAPAKPAYVPPAGGSALDQLDAGETEEEKLPEFKKQEPLFTPEERQKIIAETTAPTGKPAETELPETFYDEANLAALGQIEAGEVPRRTAAVDQLAEQQKELQIQIRTAQAFVQDLRSTNKTDERIPEAAAYLQDLQQQERDIRKQLAAAEPETTTLRAPGAREEALRTAGISEEEIQARREKFGEPGKMYPVSNDEARLTVSDLVNAGVWGTKAESIIEQAKKGKVAGATKSILQNVAAGKIEFPDGWRTATPEEVASANDFTKARYAHAANLAASATQGTLLPAQQMGLELTPATEETSREFISPIAASEEQFALTAPEGYVPTPSAVEETAVEEGPAATPLNLVDEYNINRLEDFLANLKPAAEAEQGVKNYRAAVNSLLETVQDYISGPQENRKQNLQLVNEFFNRLSTAYSPELASNFVRDIKGKTAAQQADVIKQRTKMPKINTLPGINQLRNMFQDFMEQQSFGRIGEPPGVAATKTFETDALIPTKVANVLRQLRNKPAKLMSPEEKAFMAYMSKFRYGLAMKSAAYDLVQNVESGTVFSGQGTKEAVLFKKFIDQNLSPDTVAAFELTAEEYRYKSKYLAEKFKKLDEARKRREEYRLQKKREEKEVSEYLKQKKEAAREAKYAKEIEALDELVKKSTFKSGTPAAYFKQMHPAIEDRLANSDIDGALELIERMPNARYWQLLAKRLRALNLNTTLHFDEQDRLIRFDLAHIFPIVENMNAKIADVYPDVFKKYLAPAISEFDEIDTRQYLKGLKAIKDGNLIGADVVSDTQFKLIFERYNDAVKSLDAPGFYMLRRGTDTINLNRDAGGNSYYAFFHEMLHAATAYAIRNPDRLQPAQREALENLKKLYEYTMANYPQVYEYGFTSLDEFIAEAFSNQDFQRILSQLSYKTPESKLWSKFVQYVRQLIGGKDTVLFATIANADILMTGMQQLPASSNNLTGTLMSGAIPVRRKSTQDKTFRTAPPPSASQDLARRYLDFLRGRSSWASVKGNMAGVLENVNDATRKHYLGAFTLRQLQDLIGGRLGDSAQNFINSIEGMLEDRNAILNQVEKIQKRWAEFQSKYPQENDRLSLIMIDATLAGVDPARQVGKDAGLTARWNALSSEAQEIYKEVRDFYKARYVEYHNAFAQNIEMSMKARDPDFYSVDPVKVREAYGRLKAAKDALNEAFQRDTIEPYFPLKRFGKYSFYIKGGTVNGKKAGPEFYMFDTAKQRNEFAKQRRAEMARDGDDRPTDAKNTLEEFKTANFDDLNIIKDLEEIVDTAAAGDTSELKAIIKDNIEQLYYLTLPNKSIRKMFINRKQVSGATQDMLRAFVDSSFHMAYQQSRFKHTRDMFTHLDAAKQLRESKPESMAEEKKIDSDYIAELEKRLKYVMNPTDTGTIPSLLSNVSFLWYLTAPASAVVNMMGVPAIGFPVLAARFGTVKAAATIAAYGKRFMRSGFTDADGKFAMPSLEKTKLSSQERAAYDLFVASGLIDITQSHDLAGIAEAPTTLYTGRTNTILKGFSYMFHQAERFNREVVAMSAFRMAYDKATAAGDPPFIAFNKAVDQAKDLTYRSMFDYSTLNKPRYLQNAYAKVILQFKQFPQQMTYLLAHGGFKWLESISEDQRGTIRENIMRERIRYGQPPLSAQELDTATDAEIKAMKSEGRDRLLGTLGMTFLFAGATGLPLFSIGSAVIESLYNVFSDDDEPPLDFENWFKNWLAKTFGNFAGDSIARGVITQGTGLNFADRMSLNDLWFRDARKSQDEVTAFQNMIINLLGPSAALGVSAAEALKLFNDGHVYRGMEKITPAILKQPMVAFRYSTEGVLTLKGDELVSDVSGKEALGQALGFSPERVAQRQKANIEMKTMEQEILSQRQDLMNAFFMAVDTSDDGLLDRVLDKITKFNNMYPSHPIKASSLTKSVKTRYKARALAEVTGGIPITKNLMSTLSDMGYYGDTD